jgi:hypothetical protein
MQYYLMDQLGEQKFTSLLVDALLDVVQTHFHSYAGLVAWVWLLACLSTPSFHLSSTHFLTPFHICSGIPHPIVSHLSQC